MNNTENRTNSLCPTSLDVSDMTDIDFGAEAQTWLRECGYDSTGTNAVRLAAKFREIAERAVLDGLLAQR